MRMYDPGSVYAGEVAMVDPYTLMGNSVRVLLWISDIYPNVGGDIKGSSNWAEVMQPTSGTIWVPKVGDRVWVSFQFSAKGRSQFFPVVLGYRVIPKDVADGKFSAWDNPYKKVFQSWQGHYLAFDDTGYIHPAPWLALPGTPMPYSGGVELASASGSKLTFSDTEKSTTLSSIMGTFRLWFSELVTGVEEWILGENDEGISWTRGVSATMGTTDTYLEMIFGASLALEATLINLGASASEAAVLGTTFLSNVTTFISALNAHFHTGNLGYPTTPPVNSMSLDVPLSTKVVIE